MRSDPEKGPVGGRTEVGNSRTSSLHPPHITENDEESQLQEENEEGRAVPGLPANASGSDKVSTEDMPREIDDESMYDRRPAEDKHRPPSSPQVP